VTGEFVTERVGVALSMFSVPRVVLDEAAVTVKVGEPAAAVALTLSVRVVVLDGVVPHWLFDQLSVTGLKPPDVTPVGRPVTVGVELVPEPDPEQETVTV
jgi:hypothetical protein